MYARPMTRPAPRLLSFRTLAWVAVAFMLAAAILPAAAVRNALAADPVAIYNSLDNSDLEGNPTCAAYDVTYGGGQTWQEVKKDPAGNGTITVAGFGTITVSSFDNDGDQKGFSWTSTFGIDAVLAKNGTGGGGFNVLYVYADSDQRHGSHEWLCRDRQPDRDQPHQLLLR